MDIMFDLETSGRWRGCRVFSLGAVSFNISTGEIKSSFYRNVDCSGTSLLDDPETMKWWSSQSKEAKDHLMIDRIPLIEAVENFSGWFNQVGGEEVWAQGANFDFPIWEGACHSVGKTAPWKFWNTRDTRTAYSMANLITSEIPREGVHHNALDDCIYQVKCLTQAYKNINS